MDTVTSNAAYIIKRINEIWEEKPCKKALQKMVFLFEQKGVDLGFKYGLHFYGPYSESLNAETMFLGADGVIEFDYFGRFHLMAANESRFTIEHEGLRREQRDTIDDVIGRFKGRSPLELELLTTAIYAYNHLQDKSKASVISGVKKIKGAKYTDQQIEKSLNDFAYFDKPFA